MSIFEESFEPFSMAETIRALVAHQRKHPIADIVWKYAVIQVLTNKEEYACLAVHALDQIEDCQKKLEDKQTREPLHVIHAHTKIKPIVWSSERPPTSASAYNHIVGGTSVGNFLITTNEDDTGDSWVVLRVPWSDWKESFPTIDTAKTEASYRYIKRILSCLTL